VHRPYLVVLGLWSLAHVLSFFMAADAWVERSVYMLLCVAVAVLHAIWLHALFGDGSRCLGSRLHISPRGVVVVLLISCVLAGPWTVLALHILLQLTQKLVGSRDPFVVQGLERFHREARQLFWMGSLWLVLYAAFLYLVAQRAQEQGYTADQIGGLTPLSVMGFQVVLVMALLTATVMAYYFYFAVRLVPALYRAFGALPPAGE